VERHCRFFETQCIVQQEAFEKCWARSPLRAAARRICHSPGVATVARRLRIDVNNNDDDDDDDNNDNA